MARAFLALALIVSIGGCQSLRQRNENALFKGIAQHMKDTRR